MFSVIKEEGETDLGGLVGMSQTELNKYLIKADSSVTDLKCVWS